MANVALIRSTVWVTPGATTGSSLVAAATYAGMTDIQIAAALGNITVTSPQIDVKVTSMLSVLLPTLERAKIHYWFQGKAVINPLAPAATDQVVMISYSTDAALDNLTVIPIAMQSAFLSGLQSLQSAGIVSSASVTAITALATPQIPMFSPPPTGDDVYAARFAV